jgi:hypothetical protein
MSLSSVNLRIRMFALTWQGMIAKVKNIYTPLSTGLLFGVFI